MILRAEYLAKSYTTSTGPLQVLNNIDLTMDMGELVAIMGPSGCGKSTLLNILGTLDKPDAGELHIDGTSVFVLTDAQLSELRSKTIGFVFQFHHLLPEFTVFENLIIPQMIAGCEQKASQERAAELLSKVGLENRGHHRPNSISGGERQRVAVLRALANRPKLVLADEPTGNLDSENSRILMDMIQELVRDEARSFLIVTHSEITAANCDRKFLLTSGELEEIPQK
ncbi:MAG: ABC transporter ATP-binding protein [Candidatus Marinimicrobia bacterium]|jgi:lipoprotein-releasing system ATP-binding protein|nr:ABC transporter ATP-binding protein [Candidatus Neomarinimicrobiota bacterium]MDP6594121.1 ABC transporter ATP-binding protein [Candidatus Neomarinimicrobiota bacterium]MDP6835599.1 ABC transporter ATP-binding protein [Candidatus Neomarinimicrobiota bacterium]MDP6966155.1 ABC transporter ATP-binding protein [Candidatus Neomarinimicrobiota bacterium]|tara:strand:+ start:8408 stop:9088 length:681 start_codon:yes stop_codon:yes gene_type:complete